MTPGYRINTAGADWLWIKIRNRDAIAECRRELEALTTGPDRANQLRGMIFALQALNEEVEPTPAPTVKDTNYG